MSILKSILILSFILISLFFNSCNKEASDINSDISIDAKLVISSPSTITVEINKDDFERQTSNENPISTLTLLNDSGSSHIVRRTDKNLFESSLELGDHNFSASDNFKIEVKLVNGEIIESEWMHYLQSDVSISLKTVFGENFINYRFLFSNNTDESYYLKWDAVSTFSISNYLKTLFLASDRNCERWSGVNLCQAFAGGDAETLMALVDCDGDGLSNALECDLGNDPRNSRDKIDSYDSDIDPSYTCYVTKTPILENYYAEVIPQDDPHVLLNQTSALLQAAINHEFSEQNVLHIVVNEISKRHYQYLNGEISEGNLRHTSDESFVINGFFEVTNQYTEDFIINEESNFVRPVTCKSRIFNVEQGHVCDDCKEGLRGEGDVRFIRPSYWPSN